MTLVSSARNVLERVRRRLDLSRESRPAADKDDHSPVQSTDDNPYVRKNLDWKRLAEESATRFERVYYGHRGRLVLKWIHYLPIYDRVLAPFVGKPITLVEIGVASGGSLQLWREFLGPQIRIVGIDISDHCKAFEEPGIEILIGDQGDPAFLKQVAEKVGSADIVIDDGSHVCSHQILTFETLFPIVKAGGIYVCEDLHTSYWENFGGGLGRADSFIGYIKTMIDTLHTRYYAEPLSSDVLASSVGSMLVADSLVVLDKIVPAKEAYMAWVVGED